MRTDIPVADQIVQVGHICLEAGHQFGRPATACHLVVLAVSSRRHLHEALAGIEMAGIRCVVFCEPDDGMEHTAACTGPVSGAVRRIFRRFRLWQARHGMAASEPVLPGP